MDGLCVDVLRKIFSLCTLRDHLRVIQTCKDLYNPKEYLPSLRECFIKKRNNDVELEKHIREGYITHTSSTITFWYRKSLRVQYPRHMELKTFGELSGVFDYFNLNQQFTMNWVAHNPPGHSIYHKPREDFELTLEDIKNYFPFTKIIIAHKTFISYAKQKFGYE